jgi:hypothetical protein
MARTATDQALYIIERGITVAAKDDVAFTNRCIKVSPKGYFYINGQRCNQAEAVQALAHYINEEAMEPAAIKRTGFDWNSLNPATQALFFELAEMILGATQDAGYKVAARIGHDIPSISKSNQPRLTNLKKAGVIASVAGTVKSHKMLQITDAGRNVLINAGLLK